MHGVAASLLERAGYSDADAPGARRVAESVLGPGCVYRMPTSVARAPAWLAIVHGQARIYVRTGLAPEHRNFLIGHELAEWALARDGYRGDDIEEAADAIAACLVAPRAAFRAALREIGERYDELADAFVCTESLAALRVGETTGEPMALVTPRSVRVRGDGEWVWPAEDEMRRVARRGHPGLRRARLRDDPRRVVLRAVG